MTIARLGEDLLEALQRRAWKIQRATSREPLLPPGVQQRYPRVPVELFAFLETLDSCANAAEDVWFLCREDFLRADSDGFRWNEFELMALESDDIERKAQARAFWDLYFPFMLAVHSDYDYLAVSLAEGSYGRIVHGCGPDFEETTIVAPSFGQFLSLFRQIAAGERDDYPLSHFL